MIRKKIRNTPHDPNRFDNLIRNSIPIYLEMERMSFEDDKNNPIEICAKVYHDFSTLSVASVSYNKGDINSVTIPEDIPEFENNNYYKSVIHNHPSQVSINSLLADIPSMRQNFFLNNQDAAQLICFYPDRIKIVIIENAILSFRRFTYELNRDDLSIKSIQNLTSVSAI